MRDGLRSRSAVRVKMYEKNRALYYMGAIYQDLGTGGGVAFWANSIKCFFFSTSISRGKVLFLSYLCLPPEQANSLAQVPPTANTQGRDLVVVLLTMQCPSVTAAPHFWCTLS